MAMTNRDTAAYALESLIKAGADKASCVMSRGRKDEFNVEAGEFSLLRTLFNDELSLRGIKDGRKGQIALNKTDKGSIDRAVLDCIAMTASAVPDEADDIAEKIENKAFDQRVGGADMDGLFGRTKEFLEQVSDEYPQIVFDSLQSEFVSGRVIYLNSNGVEFTADKEYYEAGASFTAQSGDRSSSFFGYGAALASMAKPFLDMGMMRSLMDEAVRSIDTRPFEGKFVGRVIVTPACEDMIWQTLMGCFLMDMPLVNGTSRWKDKLGEKVADKKLTLRLAPRHPSVVAGERFTADGYESFDTDLIKEGLLTSFALTQYGARKTGKPRCACTAFGNIVVEAGDTPLDELIKGVDRGILINRFSGAAPGPSGDVSGVAKNSFLIEGGRVTDALAETMVSFNIVDILQDIVGISRDVCMNGQSALPWCCFDGVTISGK